MADCLFCKIVKKEVTADILYENNDFLVIKDIHPSAPIHLLIITKNHIPSVDHLTENDKGLVGEMILLAQKLAQEKGLSKTGYKLNFNVGRGGGQLINHLHLHLLGGW